jgi:hypothetical protein
VSGLGPDHGGQERKLYFVADENGVKADLGAQNKQLLQTCNNNNEQNQNYNN